MDYSRGRGLAWIVGRVVLNYMPIEGKTIEIREPRKILLAENLQFGPIPLEEIKIYLEQMRRHHVEAWRRNGLCVNPDDPECQVDKFDLRETFAVRDDKELYAMTNTLPAWADDFQDLCSLFPDYRTIVETSIRDVRFKKPEKPPNYRLCFSITTARDPQGNGYSVRTEDGEKKQMAAYLLSQIPKNEERIIAYSRFGQVKNKYSDHIPLSDEEMLKFYLKNLSLAYGKQNAQSKDAAHALGATFMHANAGNALEAAILLNARPEDKWGGYANVLCAYPRDEAESNLFTRVRKQRMCGKMPFHIPKNGQIIFTDIEV